MGFHCFARGCRGRLKSGIQDVARKIVVPLEVLRKEPRPARNERPGAERRARSGSYQPNLRSFPFCHRRRAAGLDRLGGDAALSTQLDKCFEPRTDRFLAS